MHPSPQNKFVRSHPSHSWWLMREEGSWWAPPCSVVALSPNLAGAAQGEGCLRPRHRAAWQSWAQEESVGQPSLATVSDLTDPSFVLDTTPRCCQGVSNRHGSSGGPGSFRTLGASPGSQARRWGSRIPAWCPCFSSHVGTGRSGAPESNLMGAPGRGHLARVSCR